MLLEKVYTTAKSENHFYTLLKNEGVNIYFRGKQPGIQGKNRKYRLNTLGFSLERLQLLSLNKNTRTQELERIISKRLSDREQNNELEL